MRAPRGEVVTRIRAKYAKSFRDLAKLAKVESQLRQDLNDTAVLAENADVSALLDRHALDWSAMLSEASETFDEELKKLTKLFKQFPRPEDLREFQKTSIVLHARDRVRKADWAIDYAESLIEDLKEHLPQN